MMPTVRLFSGQETGINLPSSNIQQCIYAFVLRKFLSRRWSLRLIGCSLLTAEAEGHWGSCWAVLHFAFSNS